MIKYIFSKCKDLILYLIVGIIATAIEWIIFYASTRLFPFLHYNIITSIAYIISTFANWLFGRIIVFKNSGQPVIKEIVKIYITSFAGLGLNLIIMYIFIDIFSVDKMFSKIFATALVFFFNFIIRKIIIYK